jgi:hypothetical protein
MPNKKLGQPNNAFFKRYLPAPEFHLRRPDPHPQFARKESGKRGPEKRQANHAHAHFKDILPQA